MTLGGRAAEEMVFYEVTTGASNDLEKVTAIGQADGHALRHVREAGPARVRPRSGQPFLGREFSYQPDYSDDVAREIDERDPPRGRGGPPDRPRGARTQRHNLDLTSEILLRRETIERDQFIKLLNGESELDVFGPDEPVLPQRRPPAAPEAPARQPERKPRPLPRPGLAGGGAADIARLAGRAREALATLSSSPSLARSIMRYG